LPYNKSITSWIVHLRLAENLLGLIPDRSAERSRRSLEPASFAVSNIARDSGMPDEKGRSQIQQ
jgi:hypothetical protein